MTDQQRLQQLDDEVADLRVGDLIAHKAAADFVLVVEGICACDCELPGRWQEHQRYAVAVSDPSGPHNEICGYEVQVVHEIHARTGQPL